MRSDTPPRQQQLMQAGSTAHAPRCRWVSFHLLLDAPAKRQQQPGEVDDQGMKWCSRETGIVTDLLRFVVPKGPLVTNMCLSFLTSRTRVLHLSLEGDVEGGGRLVPGLAVDLHWQRLQSGDAAAAALRQPHRARQAHLQLPQVPAPIHAAHLRAHPMSLLGSSANHTYNDGYAQCLLLKLTTSSGRNPRRPFLIQCFQKGRAYWCAATANPIQPFLCCDGNSHRDRGPVLCLLNRVAALHSFIEP